MPASKKGADGEGDDAKPSDIQEEVKEVIKTTFFGQSWKVTLSEDNIEKYSAMKAEERYTFLARKMRLDSNKPLPAKEALGASMAHDLRNIRRFLDNGRLEGTRGKGLDKS